MSDTQNADYVRGNLTSLVYCITTRRRLFRWRNGHIQWAPLTRPWRWSELPLVDANGHLVGVPCWCQRAAHIDSSGP